MNKYLNWRHETTANLLQFSQISHIWRIFNTVRKITVKRIETASDSAAPNLRLCTVHIYN